MLEFAQPQRDIYTVTRLNREVRAVLEGSFPLLWVEGEISNLARPSSGHIYFTIKDEYSQVRCAMFRTQRLRLRCTPENGMQIVVRARVSLYEGRGEFQLIVEHLEPSGEGALRQAFERLKQKLAAEGLFDEACKQPLPAFPRQIGVITSPTGAALRDVLSVLQRRFPAIPVVVYPVQVQGAGAAEQICAALRLAQTRAECNVLILCRGGGSLEDLVAFNDEAVARAIHACRIPLVCGVGHEIDFTIADFVADRRAPTPSAAAELVSPNRDDWQLRLRQLSSRLEGAWSQTSRARENRLATVQQRLRLLHPGQRLRQQQQRLDELEQRLLRALAVSRERAAHRLNGLQGRLWARTPAHRLERLRLVQNNLTGRLRQAIDARLQQSGQRLARVAQTLDAVSPLATLNRGYSITRRVRDGLILRDSGETQPGEQVETRLARGRILCEVRECIPD